MGQKGCLSFHNLNERNPLIFSGFLSFLEAPELGQSPQTGPSLLWAIFKERALTLRDMVYLYKDSNKNDTKEHSDTSREIPTMAHGEQLLRKGVPDSRKKSFLRERGNI